MTFAIVFGFIFIVVHLYDRQWSIDWKSNMILQIFRKINKNDKLYIDRLLNLFLSEVIEKIVHKHFSSIIKHTVWSNTACLCIRQRCIKRFNYVIILQKQFVYLSIITLLLMYKLFIDFYKQNKFFFPINPLWWQVRFD